MLKHQVVLERELAMNQCFLRAVSGPTNPGEQCISGQTGRKVRPHHHSTEPITTAATQRPEATLPLQPTLVLNEDIQVRSTIHATSFIIWALPGMLMGRTHQFRTNRCGTMSKDLAHR